MDTTIETAPENAAANGIYLLAAHPDWRASRVNQRLLAAAKATAGVQTQDLYASYPDYSIDVAAEQARLAAARLIVLVHPVQWYSMPALQKLWVDEVLAYGWAYGPGGTALRGKDVWLVVTTGGKEDAYHPSGYNRYFFDAFLPPYEQTAVLCGMRFLPPLVLHGAHSASEEEVTEHIETFRQRLATYPQWPEIADMDECIACEVPASDRPEIDAAQVAD
ncbi:MAG: NAD(P)H dehydrogenase [Comamonadaceae bacterium]|nr:MAG: NAD(P)H dehydrogenase [Comamonadaceae bacterium]